jgi:putative endonuclease
VAAKDEVGRRGEELAARFLENQGLVIAARNWRHREGELDIIAHDSRTTIIICEVKTRSGLGYGSGAEAVTYEKQRRIRRLANLWLGERQIRPTMVLRFDVISVLWRRGKAPEISHIPEAF